MTKMSLLLNYSIDIKSVKDDKLKQSQLNTIYTTACQASNQMYKMSKNQLTDKNVENEIIASPAVVAALQSHDDFIQSKNVKQTSNINKVGTIGRFTVYRDMTTLTNYAIVSYKDKKSNNYNCSIIINNLSNI